MTTRATRSILRAAIASSLVVGATSAGRAASRSPALEVSVIQALRTDGGASIDPRLRDLPQLTHDQPFVRYNVYKLLDRRSFPLEVGKAVGESLVNGRALRVTLDAISASETEKRYQMHAQIGEPGKQDFLGNLQVTASTNEPFFVGGQSYAGGTLFLELVVRP